MPGGAVDGRDVTAATGSSGTAVAWIWRHPARRGGQLQTRFRWPPAGAPWFAGLHPADGTIGVFTHPSAVGVAGCSTRRVSVV